MNEPSGARRGRTPQQLWLRVLPALALLLALVAALTFLLAKGPAKPIAARRRGAVRGRWRLLRDAHAASQGGTADRSAQLPRPAGHPERVSRQGRARHVPVCQLPGRLPADRLQPARRAEHARPRGLARAGDRGVGRSTRGHGGERREVRARARDVGRMQYLIGSGAELARMWTRVERRLHARGRPARARVPLGARLRHQRERPADDRLSGDVRTERDRPRRAEARPAVTRTRALSHELLQVNA